MVFVFITKKFNVSDHKDREIIQQLHFCEKNVNERVRFL